MSNRTTSLYRPVEDRWLAGVAAGLALRLGVTAWIIRVAFALLFFVGGLGAFLYVAGWLLIPGEGETDAIAQGWLDTGQARRWVGVILVGLAIIILASETHFIRGDLAFAVVLIGIGVMLYRGDLSRGDGRQASTPSSGQAATESTSEVVATEGGEPPVGTPTAPSAPTPPPPREKSILGRVTAGFAVLTLGVLGLLDTVVPGFHPDFHHYVALAAGVTGLGLVVGAWFGRPGGLVVLGLLVVPILLVSPFATFVAEVDPTSVGQAHYRPGSVERVHKAYRLDVGDLVIDLREVDFAGQTVAMEARVGMGEVRVRLPAGVEAGVSGKVGMGSLRVGSHECGGIGVEGDFHRDGSEGMLVVDAEVGAGQIVVNSWPEDDRSWSRLRCE